MKLMIQHLLQTAYLGSDRREYDAVGWDAHVGHILQDIGLTDGREAQQPHHAVRNAFEDLTPGLQRAGVDLVELVEVTVDHGILRQTILLTRGNQQLFGNLFSCGSFVVSLNIQYMTIR